MINLIAAVDENWGIGKRGELLIEIHYDMKMFSYLTTGNTVVYGRNTLETFPNKKPLKGRTNCILSNTLKMSDMHQNIAPVHVIRGGDSRVKPETVINYIVNELHEKEIFIIGGQQIYEEFLEFCDIAYITKIYKEFESPDAFCPNLDKNINWDLIYESEMLNTTEIVDGKNKLINYRFTKYKNKYPRGI